MDLLQTFADLRLESKLIDFAICTLFEYFGEDTCSQIVTPFSSNSHRSFDECSFFSKSSVGQANSLSIEVASSVVIAEQITIFLHGQFGRIETCELLRQRWRDKDKKYAIAPNVCAYIDAFNKMIKWIKVTILLAQSVAKRAKIISKWICVQQHLYKLHNFQAIAAVFFALQSNPIYSLKRAWSRVPKKQRKRHENIEENVMCYSANYKKLRCLQNECGAPMIPYFGMLAKDLIFIEETMRNRRSYSFDDDAYLKRMNDAISEHLKYQQCGYDQLSSDEVVQEWMKNEMDIADKLNDEWMDKASKDVAIKDDKSKHKRSRTWM